MARRRKNDSDDVEAWWEDEEQPAPERLEPGRSGEEAGPNYRYTVAPIKRVPPLTRQLRRALQRHRLLFLYYARPVYRSKALGYWLGACIFWALDGPYLCDPPRERDAHEVLRDASRIERQLESIYETSTPQAVIGYDKGETPPPDPYEQGHQMLVGWVLHPIGCEVIDASARDIEALVDLLMTLDPAADEHRALEKARSYACPRLMRFIGWPGHEAVSWRYPEELIRAAERLEVIASLEREAAAAGWRPPAETPAPPSPTPAPTAPPAPQEPPAPAPEGQTPKKHRAQWLGHALILLRDHPEWSDRKIADQVGVHPGTLSRTPEFKAGRELIRRGGPGLRRGHLKRDKGTGRSDVEAIDADDD